MSNIGRGFGWKKEPFDQRDHRFSARPGLTRVTEVRHDQLDRYVRDQDMSSSCVGHACVAALELLCAILGLPVTRLSPLHAYWLARAKDDFQFEDGGAFIRSCLLAMRAVGCGPESMLPLNAATLAAINERPSEALENAGIKAADFRFERITGGPEAVLDALQLGHPVVMGTNVTSAFVRPKKGEVIPAPKRGDSREGGHAFLICGYDRFGARLIMKNSWSIGWGDGGFALLEPEWVDDPTTQDVHAIIAVKEAA